MFSMISFMDCRINLKEFLFSNRLTIGSWIMIGNATSCEVMAMSGFDWLAIDIEHTSIDLQNVENLIRTIQSKNVNALVRVGSNEELVVKRVLDMGADGIIVPMVCSKDDVVRAISYAKYPPFGKRGVGLYRASGYGFNFNEYKEWANENIVIIIQIEHITAVDNIDSILEVKGIDGVMIGPYDLSGSMGHPGEFDRNDFKESIDKVLKSCKKHNIPSGFHIVGTDPEFVKQKIYEGCTFLAYGIDYLFMANCAIKGLKNIKEGLKK